MIRCRNVTKSYSRKPVVSVPDLTISGGICGLLGANGAGKSTLLKLMTGLLAPDAGTISIGGHDIVAEPSIVKQMIGVVPEELGLFETLTIAENLELVGPIYGLCARTTKERAADLLDLLDLGSGAKLVSACSYGMRKKTALAMALLHNPKVLFLDEPFEGVDPSSSQAIQRVLTTAAGRGITILLTSHILPLIESFASRVLILKQGRVAWDSELADSKFDQQTYFDLVKTGEPKDLPWLGF